MNINLIQYHDRVDLDSRGVINFISIRYNGQMKIKIVPDVRKVKMINDRIFIYFNKGTEVKGTLFTYDGWIEMKKAVCYTRDGKRTASIMSKDSTWGKIIDKWDKINDDWKNYKDYIGKAYQYRRSVTYEYKGYNITRKIKFLKTKGA